MIIDIHDVWPAVFVDHEKYVRERLTKAWHKLHRFGPPCVLASQVHAFVEKHDEEIVGTKSRNFTKSTCDYDIQFPFNTETRVAADAILKKAFNYEAFRDAVKGWNAYSLCESSSYTVCPYCHIAPANTNKQDDKHKGYRPQLDHFIGRANYPFLALSLGNLVPSCATCNGPNMKHDTNVLTEPLLFPLADKVVLTFRLQPKNGEPWSPLLQALRVPLDEYEIMIDVPAGNTAAANSLKTFQLHTRYQSFLNDAYRVAKVGKNRAWLQTILSALDLTPSVQDHLGMV